MGKQTPEEKRREKEEEEERKEKRPPSSEALPPVPAEELYDKPDPVPTTEGDGPGELVIPEVDPDEDEAKSYPLGGHPAVDVVTADVNADEVMAEIKQHTDDPEIAEEFHEAQHRNLNTKSLIERLDENQAETADLTADDIDAAWDESDVGDETVGGTAPTPDQDIVDELGEAVGLTYEDDEPLAIDEKLQARDDHRWELNPDSAEEEEEIEIESKT